MKKIIYILFFTAGLCQAQIINSYAYTSNEPTPSFNGEFQFLFNNNTNEETGNHTPSATGTFSYITGPNANNPNAIALNGTQYIDLPASANFSTVNFTIAFYIRRASFPSGFDAIFEHDRFGDNWYGIYTNGTGGVLNIRSRDIGASPDDLDTPASFSTNTWYHFIASYDGTNITAYVDGVSVLNSASLPGTPTLAGIRLFRNQDNGENFVGDIARLEYWNEAKNASQASDIYDCATNGTNCNN